MCVFYTRKSTYAIHRQPVPEGRGEVIPTHTHTTRPAFDGRTAQTVIGYLAAHERGRVGDACEVVVAAVRRDERRTTQAVFIIKLTHTDTPSHTFLLTPCIDMKQRHHRQHRVAGRDVE